MNSVLSGSATCLELLAIVAEADDHGAGVEPLERLQQDVDALVQQELPEVDDRRPLAREERGESLGVALVRKTLVRAPGIRRIAPRLLEQRGERLRPRARPPLLDIHSGRYLVDAVDVTAHLLEDVADVGRPDEHRARVRERLPPPGFELGPAAHRVLELGAVRLDREACTGGDPDRPAEENVVAEHEIRGKPRAERGAVRLDPALELLPRAVLHELDLVALVAVEHENRQEPSDIGPDDLRGSEIVRARDAGPGRRR